MRYYNLTNKKAIDKRVHYIIMTDTETCNTICDENGRLDMSNVFIYDIGWEVTDKRGNLYESKSYIVKEIFFGEKDLMNSAYYSDKIPQYLEDIAQGRRKVATYYEIRQDFLDTMKRYNTKTVAAHNMRFDNNATAITQRWLTKSKYRFFFPYGTDLWDTMKMANDVIATTPSYKKFCMDNGYVTKHKKPRARVTAEILYRYITRNLDFVEEHKGLEDVDIERQIMAYCFAKHRPMAKRLGEKSKAKAEYRVIRELCPIAEEVPVVVVPIANREDILIRCAPSLV